MSKNELQALLPLMIVAATAVAVMLGIAVRRSHRFSAGLTLLGLAAGIVSVGYVAPLAGTAMTSLLVLDRWSLFFLVLIPVGGFIVAMLAYDELRLQAEPAEEFYVLLTLAVLGCQVLVCSTHFASFFLGLEILSVSLYSLVAYRRTQGEAIEAGIKYLVLAGASSAILLFGMALVYFELGSMQLGDLATAGDAGKLASLPAMAGLGLILAGVGFKLAVVPFHLWTPDVYQGASAPVAGLIASVSKGAMLALLLRYAAQMGLERQEKLWVVLAVIAIASMFVGNLLALRQNNVKRLLAYSSISHMGYMLVALLAGGALGAQAVAFYLAAYFVTILGAFGVVSALADEHGEPQALAEFRGLAWRRPVLAGVFTAMLLSLAGIPLTAGFIAKFFVLASGVRASLWVLVVVLVINSGIGLAYYLRVIVALFRQEVQEDRAIAREPMPAADSLALDNSQPMIAMLALAALSVLLVFLGVAPAALLAYLRF